MSARKHKLIVDYDYDFKIYGIISSAKEFKLAWSINNILKIALKRADDYSIVFKNNKNITILNYLYESENIKLRLFKNKAVGTQDEVNAYFIPELNRFDYLFMIHGEAFFYQTPKPEILLKQVNLVEYVLPVAVDKLKSRENLIF